MAGELAEEEGREGEQMKRIILAVLGFTGMAWGQEADPQLTSGLLNCRWWNAKTESTLIGVIIGHVQLWGFSRADIMLRNVRVPGLPPLEMPKLPPLESMTIGEVKDGVSAVCSKPENARLAIFEAMILFGEK